MTANLTMVSSFLDDIVLQRNRSTDPLILPWPSRGNLGGLLTFREVGEWRVFILELNLHSAAPEIVAGRFRLAQEHYYLGWIDVGFIKTAELVAFTALELALRDRYASSILQKKKKKKDQRNDPMLHELLKYMVQQDGLTDQALPLFIRYGAPIVSNLYNIDHKHPSQTLVGIRNSLAHGDPFEVAPWGGLLELVRDLIEYAYRSLIAELGATDGRT